MNIIAAVCANGGIGKNNDLLFNIPEDKKFFRRMTLGKTVVMGRKTYLSLPGGKGFSDRRNIILSKSADFSPADGEVCRNTEELRAILKNIPDNDIFIIGGAEIYSLLIAECDRAYITHIDASPEADKFFPEMIPNEWRLAEESETKIFNNTSFRFQTYERIKK